MTGAVVRVSRTSTLCRSARMGNWRTGSAGRSSATTRSTRTTATGVSPTSSWTRAECLRERTLLTDDDARRVIAEYVDHYNRKRLHSAIEFVTPLDKLEGRAPAIWADRDRKLAQARARRRARTIPHAGDVREEGLTEGSGKAILNAVGETDASSAGAQLARDSRPEARQGKEDGQPSQGFGRQSCECPVELSHASENSGLAKPSHKPNRECQMSVSR